MFWFLLFDFYFPNAFDFYFPNAFDFYRHSLSVTPESIICPSLSLSPRLCLSVCPAIEAYISVTISWILMKLGESVGT